MNTRESFLEHMGRILPGIRAMRKRDSLLMRILDFILFFVPDFMERYSTTLGSTMYLSDALWDNAGRSCLPTVAHEARHVFDRGRVGSLVYGFMYLFPQVLALLAFLAFWSPWWLFALLFLAPWPAWGRAITEYRGYLTSAVVVHWLYGREAALSQIEWCKSQFTGPAYYFMAWPWWKKLRTAMVLEMDEIVVQEKRDKFFEAVYQYIKGENK